MSTESTERDVESLRTGTLGLLRPPTPTLDPDWSRAQLGHILGPPAAAVRRRRKPWVAAGLVAAVLSGTGVAYAVGALPGPVERALRSSVPGHPGPSTVHMHADVDLRLPHGGRVTTWAGTVAGHPCTATVSNWDGHDRTASWGSACATDHTEEPSNADLQFFPDQHDRTYDAAVLGRTRASRADHVVVVVQTPTGVRRLRAEVDPATGGFGVALGVGSRSLASMQEEWETPAGVAFWPVPDGSPIRAVRVLVEDPAGRVLERHEVMPAH